MKTALLLVSLFLAACATPSTSLNAPALPVDNDRLRNGDILSIRISGVPTEDAGVYEVQIGDQGEITMPLLQGTFHAGGLTASELQTQIETAYKTRHIYSTPNITVVPQNRYVNVNGEIRSPQRILFTNDLTVLKAISACGGFTDYAQKRDLKILRHSGVVHFNAIAAMRHPEKDIPLQAGDQIQVDRTVF